MDFDRQKDLREIAEGKHDVCDNADEKAMNETEWRGSYKMQNMIEKHWNYGKISGGSITYLG